MTEIKSVETQLIKKNCDFSIVINGVIYCGKTHMNNFLNFVRSSPGNFFSFKLFLVEKKNHNIKIHIQCCLFISVQERI